MSLGNTIGILSYPCSVDQSGKFGETTAVALTLYLSGFGIRDRAISSEDRIRS